MTNLIEKEKLILKYAILYAFTQSIAVPYELLIKRNAHCKESHDVFRSSLMARLLKNQEFINHIADEISKYGPNQQFNLLN